MKRRKIVALSVALLLSLVVAAGAAVAAGLYAASVLASGGVTTPENALSAPDGQFAVWNPTSVGEAALDMGQQVCGPLYVYAPAPEAGTSASGLVFVFKSLSDFDPGNMQPAGGNFLYAADYANGRYVVKQLFPHNEGGAPDPTQQPYTGSFQVVDIYNFSMEGYTPLTVDAVQASSCQNDQGQNNNKQGQNKQ